MLALSNLINDSMFREYLKGESTIISRQERIYMYVVAE